MPWDLVLGEQEEDAAARGMAVGALRASQWGRN